MINGPFFTGKQSFNHYVENIGRRRRWFRYDLEYKRLNRYISRLNKEDMIIVKPFHYSVFCKYLQKNYSKKEIGSIPLYWVLMLSNFHNSNIQGMDLLFQFSNLHNDDYYFISLDESEKTPLPFNFLSVLICNFFYNHHIALNNYITLAEKISDKNKLIKTFENTFFAKGN